MCDAGGGLAVWTPEANVKARPVGGQQQQQHVPAAAGTAASAAGGGSGPAAAAALRPLVPGRITCVCAASGPGLPGPAGAASPGAQPAQSPAGGHEGQGEGGGPAAAAGASGSTAEGEAGPEASGGSSVTAEQQQQQLAVVGTADGWLHVVDVAAGELVASVQAHRGAVRSLQLVGLPYLCTAAGGLAAAAFNALSAAAPAAGTAHAAPGADLWLVSSGEDELAKVGRAGCGWAVDWLGEA